MSEVHGIIAVIPARSGSKGIRGKNVTNFCGEPLITWSIKAALASNAIDRVIVSTDCEEIAAISREAGAEVPFIRPRELAEDQVHAVHVILHVIEWLVMRGSALPEGIMMLLPTSPLRQAADISGAVDLFRARKALAVISVTDLGKYPTNLRFMADHRLSMTFSEVDKNAQRQGLNKLYGVNGSIFLARPHALKTYGTFHIEGALGYLMDQIRSVDINDPADLELAAQFYELLKMTSSIEVKS